MGASHFPWIESGEVPLVEILHQPFGCRQMLRRKQSWRRLPQLEASSLCHLTNKFGRNPWVRLVFFGQFDFTHSRIIWIRRFQGFNCCWPRLIERKQREIGQGANAKNKLHQKTVGSIFSGGVRANLQGRLVGRLTILPRTQIRRAAMRAFLQYRKATDPTTRFLSQSARSATPFPL